MEHVTSYVAGCVKCQKSEADKYRRQTKLVLIATRKCPFQEIATHFVGELPEWEAFKGILVVTDQFTKVQQYIAAKTTWNTENVANSYIKNIWKLYSLSRHICLDSGLQIIQKLLKELN